MSRTHRPPRRCAVLAAACLLTCLPGAVGAAVYYVGTGATCGDQPNDRSSIADALFSAAFTTADDEIRLTRTLSYTNEALDLVDWHAGHTGELLITGGYDDCDDTSASGRVTIDGKPGLALVTVRTSSQSSSVVTLRDLELTGAELRGAAVSGGGELTLQNVWIHDNGGGAAASAGGSLSVDAASELTDNSTSGVGGGVACSGAGSYVGIAGKLRRNLSDSGGGSLFVGSGCLTELFGGAVLQGFGEFPADEVASFGGGVYVNDGVLVANGGASRVLIQGHNVWKDGRGGGIFAHGENALVVLFNTVILDNSARILGAGIHAQNGATVIMDRVEACPFIISCSLIQSNRTWGGDDGEAVSVDGAHVRLLRSIVLDNGWGSELTFYDGDLFHVTNAGVLDLDGVALWRNYITDVFDISGGGEVTAQYVTVVRNHYLVEGATQRPRTVVMTSGDLGIFSSIVHDTTGFDVFGGTESVDCVLFDPQSTNGNPSGAYWTGQASFNDLAGGDLRQLSLSAGVDFCDETKVPWPGSLDIEMQPRGGDMPVNPNGSPGIGGGTFDIGFDEALAPSNHIFSDGFESGDPSAWSASVP